MTYQEAVTYLESLIDYERTPAGAAAARSWNLDRMRRALDQLGNPHHEFPSVHIAGTKGKGSTAAMAASILSAAGYRTGLYTSPHLVSFRERIRIGDQMIPEGRVAELTARVRPVLESLRRSELGPPSFFEAYTMLAFLHFAEERVEVAVVETGLGGRLDATNVLTPLACAITRIARDHVLELGDTIPQIAREKAGIVKPGVPVVSAPQEPEALEVLQETCLERGARLVVVGEDEGPQYLLHHSDRARQVFSVRGLRASYQRLECPLLGRHQAENAAVAIGLVELAAERGLEVAAEAIRAGIRAVRWPGRLQVVSRRPYVILDGAHDEAAAEALAAALRSLFPGFRIVLVLGVGRDKDAEAIARVLCPLADRVIATASESPRALDAHELQQIAYRHARHTSAYTPVSLAVREAIERAGPREAVVITGSLYVVGEAMRALGIQP